MGTITDKINKSLETKEAIRQAIINKGVDIPANTVFSDYPEKISAITGSGEGGSGGIADAFYLTRTNNETSYVYLFYGCNATELDVSNFNTEKVTTMHCMFNSCSNLTSLDVSNFNTSNVTIMNSMFDGCSKLTSLDVSNFNTSKVTSMQYMFRNCSSLITLDLSNFDTSYVTNTGQMFYGCPKLTSLDLRNFDLNKCTSSSACSIMFYNCTSLHTIRLDNCDNYTINKIITSSSFPTGTISGVTRKIYCKQANASGLTAPTNWTFSYV